MLLDPATPAPPDLFLSCICLLGSWFAFWLAIRSDIATQRRCDTDSLPSHDDLARRQAEIDTPSKTRLL